MLALPGPNDNRAIYPVSLTQCGAKTVTRGHFSQLMAPFQTSCPSLREILTIEQSVSDPDRPVLQGRAWKLCSLFLDL